ncbi:MAG: hypothetical protein Q9220_001790 [cf. Caloplaca sp. 1 TL-2023]
MHEEALRKGKQKLREIAGNRNPRALDTEIEFLTDAINGFKAQREKNIKDVRYAFNKYAHLIQEEEEAVQMATRELHKATTHQGREYWQNQIWRHTEMITSYMSRRFDEIFYIRYPKDQDEEQESKLGSRGKYAARK